MSNPYVLEERGNWRVLLRPDEYPDEPDDDSGPPIIRIDRSRYRSGLSSSAEHVMTGSRPAGNDSRIEEAAERWASDLNLFEKYLRAYHGTTQTMQYGPNQVTDYTYIAYDTAEWRAYVGFKEGKLPPPGSVNLNEWRAYLEGDVYYYTVQKQVTWKTDDPDFDDETRWEDVPDYSVGGFYGYQYAEESAREALTEAIEAEEERKQR